MDEAGSQSPHLEEHQQDQAAEHAPLRALVIHEIIRAEGESELKRTVPALFWSGLAAGLSMGFSYVTQALLHSALTDAPWRHAIASFGYTVGFALVVLGRQQLFTESTLTAVLPVLTRRDGATLTAMLRLWGVVLVANLVGTWLFAVALAYAHPLPPEAAESLATLASQSVAHPFGHTFITAIFAGWLIALMVWLLPSAGTARILIIVLLTWVVSLARFSHIIAGSSEAAYAVLTGAATGGDYLMKFLIPTLLGNTLGGAALVALLNHAPVKEEMNEAEAPGA